MIPEGSETMNPPVVAAFQLSVTPDPLNCTRLSESSTGGLTSMSKSFPISVMDVPDTTFSGEVTVMAVLCALSEGGSFTALCSGIAYNLFEYRLGNEIMQTIKVTKNSNLLTSLKLTIHLKPSSKNENANFLIKNSLFLEKWFNYLSNGLIYLIIDGLNVSIVWQVLLGISGQ
jgi:hypothetical protein